MDLLHALLLVTVLGTMTTVIGINLAVHVMRRYPVKKRNGSSP